MKKLAKPSRPHRFSKAQIQKTDQYNQEYEHSFYGENPVNAAQRGRIMQTDELVCELKLKAHELYSARACGDSSVRLTYLEAEARALVLSLGEILFTRGV